MFFAHAGDHNRPPQYSFFHRPVVQTSPVHYNTQSTSQGRYTNEEIVETIQNMYQVEGFGTTVRDRNISSSVAEGNSIPYPPEDIATTVEEGFVSIEVSCFQEQNYVFFNSGCVMCTCLYIQLACMHIYSFYVLIYWLCVYM